MSAVQSVGPQALPALQEQVEQILAEAKRQGASACEVAVSLEQGLSTSVRQREVETVEFNRDQGFGITLYMGQRKGSASTSASGPEAIRETVAAALAIAKHTSEDEASGLADAALMCKELRDFDLFHAWDITPSRPSNRHCVAKLRHSRPTAGSRTPTARRSIPTRAAGSMATATVSSAVMHRPATASVA
ncbi:DNA gyrase modulator [Pseudomonas sp. NA13]